eukprot:TRINITY_DN3673_c0_g1_i1.p1 TRINITY_DN3673_c0_g1~~TRINITY_DN3673_c0_g1_i1.p1  ORF type:complete len:444 (-),score=65.40 TRINITY_DN3673_c0_g1_i1:790-2061(-)
MDATVDRRSVRLSKVDEDNLREMSIHHIFKEHNMHQKTLERPDRLDKMIEKKRRDELSDRKSSEVSKPDIALSPGMSSAPSQHPSTPTISQFKDHSYSNSPSLSNLSGLARPRSLTVEAIKMIKLENFVQKRKNRNSLSTSQPLPSADSTEDEETFLYKSSYPPRWPQKHEGFKEEPLLLKEESGFNSEFGMSDADQEMEKPMLVGGKMWIEDAELDVCFYKDFMSEKAHINLLGDDDDFGPVIISIDNTKALVRTKRGDERYIVSGASDKDRLKSLFTQFPEISNVKLSKPSVELPSQITSLTTYENKFITKTYKFGVLYIKEGQKTENEWYSNVETSAAYDEFLAHLGTKVELKGFKNFRGGLDVTNNTTGNFSVYTTFQAFEIMFHVATLLPYHESDVQRLERKRHIGNYNALSFSFYFG